MARQKTPLSAADRERVALLNALIERESQEVSWRVGRLRRMAAELRDQPVTTHPVSHEGERPDDGPSARDLRELADLALAAAQHHDTMTGLVRTKLKLFDDCDFPGGGDLRSRVEALKADIPEAPPEAPPN
jgi:hypothetical protein